MPPEKPKRVIGEDGELTIDAPDLRKRKTRQRRPIWVGIVAGVIILIASLIIFMAAPGDPNRVLTETAQGMEPPPPVVITQSVLVTQSPSTDATPIPESMLAGFADCDELIAQADPNNLTVTHTYGSLSPLVFLQDSASGGTCMPQVPPGQASYLDPVLSPDRQKLFYVRFVELGDKADLYVANANGTGARAIAPGISRRAPEALIWAPDGSALLYIAYDVPERFQRTGMTIHTVSPDGSQTRLIAQIPGQITMPTWSPDSTRLAFVAHKYNIAGDATPAIPQPTIYVVNVATGELTDVGAWITNGRCNICVARPQWSDDGRSLIFSDEYTDPDHLLYSLN